MKKRIVTHFPIKVALMCQDLKVSKKKETYNLQKTKSES